MVGCLHCGISHQDWRPQSKILFPLSDDFKDDDQRHVYFDPDRNSFDDSAFPKCYNRPFYNRLLESFNSQKSVGYATQTQLSTCGAGASASASAAIDVGIPFDVITMLSSCGIKELVRGNGERVEVESLRGKNIMVCCVFVPIYYNSHEACVMRALPFACSEAFSGEDYEVVMVPKMLRNWVNDSDAFDHFLSGFPSSDNWLAIPFSDTQPCDSVCKLLGLKDRPVYLLVDRNQKVLVYTWTYTPCKFSGFSFSQETMEFYHHWWKKTSCCQLYSILDCKPSDFVYQLSRSPGNKVDNKVMKRLPISELKDKVVGLYLCREGSFIRALNIVHQECKARNLDFEIVVVYLPYNNDHVDPQLFIDSMNHLLLIVFNVSNWWVLPFDDFKSRKIWKYCTNFMEDELLIVGPHDEFVEPFGRHVMFTFGSNAYPFSRKHIIEKRYQELRALTLESLLIYGPLQNYVLCQYSISDYSFDWCCDLEEVPVEDLQGKTVLLYLDNSQRLDHSLYINLLYWYCYHKQHAANTGKGFDDFEVVFVDLDDYGFDGRDDTGKGFSAFQVVEADANYDHPTLQMPWLLSPNFGPQHSNFVRKNLLKDTLNEYACVAAFGKDGRILSIEAQDLLESYGPDDIQSYDGLHNEVAESVLGTIGQSGALVRSDTNETDIYEM